MKIFIYKGFEITPSESCPISGDRDKLGISNLAGTSLMNSYLILQNTRFIAFTVSEILRENQEDRKNYPTLTQNRVNDIYDACFQDIMI